jgi:predicted DNA-binding protein YlxM (UPF0122 family)/phosphoribosylpyrophosphate synthetase
MKIKAKIYNLLKVHNELSVKELVDELLVSKQAIHNAINQLVEEKLVEKLGKVPKTAYRVIKKIEELSNTNQLVLEKNKEIFLQKNIFIITENGKLTEGVEAFSYWCKQRNLPIEKTINEYIETKNRYNKYYSNDFINGTEKLLNTKGYSKIWLNELFYIDFYAIERFGKTRLGTLLHYAKQGQNKMLMKILVDEIKEKVLAFIKTNKVDAVAFVPPTIRREVQIMKFIQTHLKISLPIVEIRKISGMIPVPQKSLNKLEERISNAENTFSVVAKNNFKRLLLIDDAVGSGATLNEIAGKIKNKKIATEVIGLSVVGSFKGFDVITDI